MCGIMLVLRAVFNMLVRNAIPRWPMCFRCLMFSLSGPCELIFLLSFNAYMNCGECDVISLYFIVALLMVMFVLCVVCLTVFMKCLVKQFAICLGVFRSPQLRCDLSGLSVNVGESQITQSLKVRDLGVTFDQFLNFDDHITAICRNTYFHIRNIGKIRNLLSYNACSAIIHALISCRLDYCNSLLYNVPTHKTDRLQRLQNQCARILTKSPRREHITPVLKSLHWLKIQDRITYKILMLTYKSYYNIAPTYLCELISRRESSVNTRLGSDQHQLIMPPISKDCSNTFLERSFIYAAPCEWNKLSECIRTSSFDSFRKSVKTMLFTQQYG